MPSFKSENLKGYAKERGLEKTPAGEVLLAAALTHFDDWEIDDEQLEGVGILPTDTEDQVIEKLRAAITGIKENGVNKMVFEEEGVSPEEASVASNGVLTVEAATRKGVELALTSLGKVLGWLGAKDNPSEASES